MWICDVTWDKSVESGILALGVAFDAQFILLSISYVYVATPYCQGQGSIGLIEIYENYKVGMN